MVVVEVTRKAYLASIVPVIVNAVLNEHQVVADIVAFVSHGDFPRSRLGEKQRGKVLASWVTRKLRTMAQFSIRDMEGSENPFAEAPQHRGSRSSKPGSMMGNSTRRSTAIPDAESTTVPRSPAPVLVEHPELSSPSGAGPGSSYPPSQGEGAPLASPTASTMPAVPQIAEPTRPSTSSTTGNYPPANGGAPTTIGNPDFGFDFGDFANATTTASVGNPGAPAPVPVPETLPYRPATGHDSFHSQQQQQPPQQSQQYMSYPGAAATGHPDPQRDTGEWPQEALMYQSAMGADDGYHRKPAPYQ